MNNIKRNWVGEVNMLIQCFPKRNREPTLQFWVTGRDSDEVFENHYNICPQTNWNKPKLERLHHLTNGTSDIWLSMNC